MKIHVVHTINAFTATTGGTATCTYDLLKALNQRSDVQADILVTKPKEPRRYLPYERFMEVLQPCAGSRSKAKRETLCADTARNALSGGLGALPMAEEIVRVGMRKSRSS